MGYCFVLGLRIEDNMTDSPTTTYSPTYELDLGEPRWLNLGSLLGTHLNTAERMREK
mgnify:CR=1 FL=1